MQWPPSCYFGALINTLQGRHGYEPAVQFTGSNQKEQNPAWLKPLPTTTTGIVRRGKPGYPVAFSDRFDRAGGNGDWLGVIFTFNIS